LLMSTWHLAIYIWLIIMPISGLLLLNANTWSIDIFNFHFSWIISQNRELWKTLKDIHETLSWIGIFLIVWHIIPVLFHHYIIEDNTLVRMYKYVNKR
jgi:cytochrome b561